MILNEDELTAAVNDIMATVDAGELILESKESGD
jgi:hypothetical protein